jgi:hypothetical protein
VERRIVGFMERLASVSRLEGGKGKVAVLRCSQDNQ